MNAGLNQHYRLVRTSRSLRRKRLAGRSNQQRQRSSFTALTETRQTNQRRSLIEFATVRDGLVITRSFAIVGFLRQSLPFGWNI